MVLALEPGHHKQYHCGAAGFIFDFPSQFLDQFPQSVAGKIINLCYTAYQGAVYLQVVSYQTETDFWNQPVLR